MQSPYFNTFSKVHPFYFISRSNEVFTALSTYSKLLIIKPSQKLICASGDVLSVTRLKSGRDRCKEKEEVGENRTMLRVHG